MKKVIQLIPIILQKAFSGYVFLVLLMMVFVAPFVSYFDKDYQTQFAFIYIPIAVVMGICLFSFVRSLSAECLPARLNRLVSFFRDDVHFSKLVVALGFLLFLAQLAMTCCCYFISGWDVGVLTDVNTRDTQAWYYSQYPNSLFLAGLFSLCARVMNWFGFYNYYLLFTLGALACTTTAITLSTFVASALFGKKWAILSFLVMAVFIGLNPMCMVPYSDSYGMLFTSLGLFAAICVKNPFAKSAFIVFFGFVGYCVKPTVIFFVVAVMLVEFACHISKAKLEKQSMALLPKAMKIIASCAISFLMACGITTVVKGCADLEIDSEKSFSAAHYLMMGFNERTDGVYAQEDVEFSAHFDGSAERSREDLVQWTSRVQDMGFPGVTKLLAKKSLINYGSGTFSFLTEGNAFVHMEGKSDVVQEWYGIPNVPGAGHSDRSPWGTLSQVLWIMTLIGISLCLLQKKATGGVATIAVTLLLLSGFLLLFECRARYLFLYAPYFVLMGIAGWRCCIDRLACKSSKILCSKS